MTGNALGFENNAKVEIFARMIHDAFDGDIPYLVGSAMDNPKWRDVDIRLILSDEEFTERYGHIESDMCKFNWPKWNAECLAFTLLGKHITGLPIDFQIQSMDFNMRMYSNEHKRMPMMMYKLREVRSDDTCEENDERDALSDIEEDR